MTAAMLEYRRLRAPRENGQSLVDPAWDEVAALLVDTQTALACAADYDLQGRTLGQVAEEARAELLRLALSYTRGYRDVSEPSATDRIFLAGHQPELFHPGVWFKNFALDHLARAHDAVAVNLVIDNDVAGSPAIRVPSGQIENPGLHVVPYDKSDGETPHEERAILDHSLLASFPSRVQKLFDSLVSDPLLPQFWPSVIERATAGVNLGQALSQARHQLEGRWGLETLEVPHCQLCDTEPFRWFVCHLLAHLPRFWEVYNRSLAEFRQVNRVRSATHPVPDLSSTDGYLEAPFWIWSTSHPRRRRLFAKQRGEELLLSDRHEFECALPLSAEVDAARAVEQLGGLRKAGIKIRTRALTTTLWSRLVLGDAFLHGIGGSKYDQLTDVVLQQFFGCPPPRYLTLSATLELPIPWERDTAEQLHQVDHHLRQLQYKPELHVSPANLDGAEQQRAGAWIDSKAMWVAAPPTRESTRQRYLGIRQANDGLQEFVAAQRAELQQLRGRLQQQLRGEAILASREYAFVLHPEESLRRFMLAIVPTSP